MKKHDKKAVSCEKRMTKMATIKPCGTGALNRWRNYIRKHKTDPGTCKNLIAFQICGDG